MPSFDKFVQDLERRSLEKKERLERLRRAEEEHALRNRVARYTERWQNSVQYKTRGEK